MAETSSSRSIRIQESAIGSTIVSGAGNTVYVTHQAFEPEKAIAPTVAANELGPNPYKGLAAFKEDNADYYFGRENQVARLIKRFQALYPQSSVPRFLPILGPSGCGKSSLVRAGFIPELARQLLPGLEQMRVAVLVPGSYPLEALAGVLAKVATNDPLPVEKTEEFERVLKRTNDAGEYEGLRRIASLIPDIQDSPLLILVDQFEEIYSLCKDLEQRQAFINTLLHAASDPSGYVSVVITLRSDFLAEAQQHKGLNQVISSDQSMIVTAMTEAELRKAIAEPAKQAGHPLDESTIDLLVNDTKGREGALPVLQFALTRIWEGLRAGVVPSKTLEEIGNLEKLNTDIVRGIYQREERSRNEETLLQSVRTEVDSRIKQSILNGLFIDLSKQRVENHLESNQVPAINLPDEEFSDQNILDIFDRPDVNGRLLILGEPGVGKTTTLLELARFLVIRAEQQVSYPIPVLLSLSSWQGANFVSKNLPTFNRVFNSRRYLSLQEWMTNELKIKYGLNSKLSEQLIDDGKLIPMLDGLDEVESKERISCAEAVNEFLRQEKQFDYCVVCCRTTTYRSLPTLQLNCGIVLNPITRNQVLNYLDNLKNSELLTFFQQNSNFHNQVKTPLMLAIICKAYQDESILDSQRTLEGIKPSQMEIIRKIIDEANQARSRISLYSLKLDTVTESLIGESIKVIFKLIPCVAHDSDDYTLDISNRWADVHELNIFLDFSGFQFDGANSASIPLDDSSLSQVHSLGSLKAQFNLISLRPGLNSVRADVYRGNDFETSLVGEVNVSSIANSLLYSYPLSRSRPVPQPDLILQIQTGWNETLANCTFNYHLDSFHPRLAFASEIQQRSETFSAEWMSQTRRYLQNTLEEAGSGLPEDFSSRLTSLGKHLFQQLLPQNLISA